MLNGLEIIMISERIAVGALTSGVCIMDTVFISIIIDNYNYERYLAKAIDSALRQTYPYREVIVVDDGSTDDSLSIIESYGSQIRAVLKDNGGQASAFNAGWEICQGDLVIFLDSDDILLPNALEAVARQYEANRDLGIAKLQYSLQVVSSSGKPMGYPIPDEHPQPGDVLAQLLRNRRYSSPPTSGNAFTRTFLERVMPVPEEFQLGADSYLVVHAPFLGQVVPIREILGQYCVHGDNHGAGFIDYNRLLYQFGWYELNNKMMKAAADKYGFILAPPTADWKQIKINMMRYKLGIPLAIDLRPGAFSIAAAGIRAVAGNDKLSPVKKTAYSLWFVLVAMIPYRWAGLLRWLFTHFYSWYVLRNKVRTKLSQKVSKDQRI